MHYREQGSSETSVTLTYNFMCLATVRAVGAAYYVPFDCSFDCFFDIPRTVGFDDTLFTAALVDIYHSNKITKQLQLNT